MDDPNQKMIDDARELVAECIRAAEAARIDAELAQQRLEKALEALCFANEALEQAVLSKLSSNQETRSNQ